MPPAPKRKEKRAYIFVVGGVISGVGKGIATSSIGKILQAKGFRVTAIKIDPYINLDAGTMNPTEHGEVFVLNDGYETDQDMGNYERFLEVTLPEVNYMTTGRVYQHVIEKERNLEYHGKNVEVVPDVPFEIIHRIEKAARLADAEITIVEVGGTVGEYQNILFLEAARMMKVKAPRDVSIVMLSYLPIPSKLGEMKTKPTQYAVRTLNSAGLHPDIVIGRSAVALDQKRKEKIARNCNLVPENVISAPDIESIYDVPLNFEKDKLADKLIDVLGLSKKKNQQGLSSWKKFVSRSKNPKKTVNLAVVGKYFDTGDFVLSDSYISVIEAVKFSAYQMGAKPVLHWINAKEFENGKPLGVLSKYDGILVPGGFGSSGVEGKIKAIAYARTHKIPYFGLCYGMQLAVIEFARNAAKMKTANTTEVDPNTAYPVIDIMPDQKGHMEKKKYGGTMRLGAYPALLKKGSIARSAYGKEEISERHRHRYEVNPEFIEKIEAAGLVFSGKSPDGVLMEIAELPKSKHPFFVGTQFHPEFLARPLHPHPLFSAFVKAALDRNRKRK